MERFHYNHPDRRGIITVYYIPQTGEWFSGKGCHMKAFAAWGSLHPHKRINRRFSK